MNKKRLSISALTITLIVVVVIVIIQNRESEPAPVTSSVGESSELNKNTSTSSTLTSQDGSYQTYEEAKIAKDPNTKVLFFHAEWCPQCKAIEADIEQDGVPAGVSIYKVDYDNSTELRQKHGVTLQTTFVVVDSNGNQVKKHVAYSEPTFDAVKEAIL